MQIKRPKLASLLHISVLPNQYSGSLKLINIQWSGQLTINSIRREKNQIGSYGIKQQHLESTTNVKILFSNRCLWYTRLHRGVRHCLHWRSKQLYTRNCRQCLGMCWVRKLNWWCSLLELEPPEQGVLPKNFGLWENCGASKWNHVWHSGMWIIKRSRQEYLCLKYNTHPQPPNFKDLKLHLWPEITLMNYDINNAITDGGVAPPTILLTIVMMSSNLKSLRISRNSKDSREG